MNRWKTSFKNNLSNIKKKMMSLDIRNKKKKRSYFSPEKEEVPEKPGEYKSTGSATDTGICGTELRKIVSK